LNSISNTHPSQGENIRHLAQRFARGAVRWVRGTRSLSWLLDHSEKKSIDIADEYVTWVYYVNAGMLDRGNLYCFDFAMQHLPSEAPILEIGSFCGLSTNLLGYYKRQRGRSNALLTCEDWSFGGAAPGPEFPTSRLAIEEYRALVKETFLRNVKMFSARDLPGTVEISAEDFFAAWRKASTVIDVFGTTRRLGGPLSFCYIDGNHSYESAERDFLNCDEFVEPGGFILFDDSSDDSAFQGVRRVVAEVKDSPKYRLVMKNPNYLFQKKL
jgi:hypothetical protein